MIKPFSVSWLPIVAVALMLPTPLASREAEKTYDKHKVLFVGNRSMMLSWAVLGGVTNKSEIPYSHGETNYVFTNGPVAIRNLRLTYANYALQPSEGSVPVANLITIEAAVFVQGSHAPVRVTFGPSSAPQMTIAKEGEVSSNVVRIQIAPFATFSVRTGVYVDKGQTWPVGYFAYHPSDYSAVSDGQTSHVMASEADARRPGGTISTQFGYGPVAVTGTYDAPDIAIASVGDSLTTGNTGASRGNHVGDRGTLPYGYATAPGGRVAYSKLARDSAFLTAFDKPELSQHRVEQLKYATHVVVWLGTNDVGAKSVAKLQQSLLHVWALSRLGGRKVIAVTLPPRTRSTDQFATTENQTPWRGWEPGGKRDQLNAWIKSQVGVTVDDVLDFNPIWESKSKPGSWNIGLSGDGTHPREVAMQAVRDIVAKASGKWREAYLADLNIAAPSPNHAP